MENITVEGVPGTGGLRPGETDRLRIVGHRGQSEWQPPRRWARSAGGARLRCGLEATRKQGHGGGVGSRRGAETPRTELREQARGARRRAAGGCGGGAAAAGFARLCVVAGSLHNHVSSTAETLIFDERRGTTGGIESTLFILKKHVTVCHVRCGGDGLIKDQAKPAVIERGRAEAHHHQQQKSKQKITLRSIEAHHHQQQ